jgi:dihydrofolate synthase/folylpolyglutamate synthase
MKSHPILHEVSKAGIRLGIDRFHSFIEYIGNPLTHYPVIHVAGTNGKGSIVRMLESCLHHAGYRVGSYTSPHLQQVNERIQVGNEMISDARLGLLLEDLSNKSKQWSLSELQIDNEISLTHFEILTVAAMQYFSDEKVDIAIIEVGLGGRYDATNIVSPLVSIISSISRDHTELLGSDDASIAAEKAGIIKENTPVVAGMLSSDALRSIRTIAHERFAALYILGVDIRINDQEEGLDIQFLDQMHLGLPVPLLGSHQSENLALAVCALQLVAHYFPISESELKEGLQKVQYPGRIDWVDENILVDCAHNEAGARVLGEYLMGLKDERRRSLVIGISQEKDIRSIILSLAPHVDSIYTIAADHHRAVPAQELHEKLLEMRLESQVVDGFSSVHNKIDTSKELLIVSGSIFLVGAYLDWRDETIGL